MNTELIARLEAAEVGSDELSLHVHLLALGHDSGFEEPKIPATVTTSLDAALALAVRTVGENAALSMLFIVAGCCDSIRKLPLGLCISVLRALDAQEAV